MWKNKYIHFGGGFTLMELMVVIAVIALIAAATYANWLSQLQKAYDSRRKSDLAKLKIMLENYYNDNGCFPTVADWQSAACDSKPAFMPGYTDLFYCDPETKARHQYEPIGIPTC